MLDAPQQNWAEFTSATRDENDASIRRLTAADRFSIYADLFNVIWVARGELGNWERLDRWRWEQKLDERRRLVAAFNKLDQLRRERTAANDAR
ncbi:MAG TPA: hypothetical protein VGM76_04030 [Lacipirellulaceae bacterium]|jgi:hypothetical protein